VIPLLRVSLTMEHVAAWIEGVLTQRCGRRCKRIGSWGDGSNKRLPAMLKLTQADASLVYCTHHGPKVILVRDGRVLKVPFCLTYTLGDLLGVIREEARHDDDVSHPHRLVAPLLRPRPHAVSRYLLSPRPRSPADRLCRQRTPAALP
jgi:hypothetical protein